jgi:hypothetical protein
VHLAYLLLSLPHSTQGHINHPVLQQITAQMIPGAPTIDWDGMAIFEAESYAKIFEVLYTCERLSSQEYIKACYETTSKSVPLILVFRRGF